MKFNTGGEKTFRGDFDVIKQALKNRERFAFSKSADGELSIMIGRNIDLTGKANGEFKYKSGDPEDESFREELLAAFRYKDEGYHVSVGCPCCVGDVDFRLMKDLSDKGDDAITWANIFVNSNYPKYKEEVIPLFSDYDVVLICNKKADLSTLPFEVWKDFRIGTNAWKNDAHLIDDIKKWMIINGGHHAKDKLFLFCAGPFGNILIHKLWQFNKENTYLDVGSTLDPWLFGENGYTRGYLRGASTLRKICRW